LCTVKGIKSVRSLGVFGKFGIYKGRVGNMGERRERVTPPEWSNRVVGPERVGTTVKILKGMREAGKGEWEYRGEEGLKGG